MTDDLDEIFGIPIADKKSEDHAGAEEAAFSDTMNEANGVAFEDQASKVGSSIKHVGMSSKNINRNNSDVTPKIQNHQDESHVNEIVKHSDARKEEHDAMGDSNPSSKAIDEKKVDSVQHSKKLEENKIVEYNIFSGFNIECRDYDLENFYNIKRDALATWLLPGGVIHFSNIMDELRLAKPDLTQVVFGDMQSMFVALKQIQKWKDRITAIQIDVNQQFYSWKRAIELFRGVLARCRYEKPSEKQDGVVMEHMGDMIMYMSKLESLHSSASAVRENLDNAFDCISRQITTSVSTMGKDVDFVEKKAKNAINATFNSEEYDSVSSVSPVASSMANKKNISAPKNSKESKAGTVDWI